jgi:hypothetical protein
MIKQNTYILYNEHNEFVVDKICKQISIEQKIYSPFSELTVDILRQIATTCKTEYFYVIKTNREIVFNFDFTFKPSIYDRRYVHVWDDTVFMFNTFDVLSDPEKYTDSELRNGNLELKSNGEKICSYPTFDIVFLSYDEEYADENYKRLLKRFPRAKRVHGVKGIFAAHRAAAELARTDMVYIVDADADIWPAFYFDYQPHSLDRQSVLVWHSLNPVNGLDYGYGAVKMFPTDLLLNYTGSPVDFTTSVSNSFKVIPSISNITRFNTDPFSAWRSGFRECVKLASKIIHNQDNTETEERLAAWCTKGADKEFGDFTIMGANEGAAYGELHKNQPELLGLINDYAWLAKRFSS